MSEHLDSILLGGLRADTEINELFSARALCTAMLEVEGALARALAATGLIPAAAAAEISATAQQLQPDLSRLATSTARHGVPVIELVATLREATSASAAEFVHFGATSQDILDTALVLQLRAALELLDARLQRLCKLLAALADAHRGTVMVARTRWQKAVPTTFGVKAAGWLAPLLRHRQRLTEMRERSLVVQLGGAAGTLAAYRDEGPTVVTALAAELELAVAPMPWHNQRDTFAECGSWLSLVTGSLGKIGQDVLLMAQTEIAELQVQGGSSSTMPQKRNPVKAENLLSAARINVSSLATLQQAQIHAHERDGSAWQLEWASLPQMIMCTGGACHNAVELLQGLQVDATRMLENARTNGVILAEAIGFKMTRNLARAEVRSLLDEALAQASNDTELVALLQKNSGLELDWEALADPANYLGASEQFIDAVLALQRTDNR